MLVAALSHRQCNDQGHEPRTRHCGVRLELGIEACIGAIQMVEKEMHSGEKEEHAQRLGGMNEDVVCLV